MILELRMPRLNPNMAEVVIEVLHQQPGAELKSGDKLFDLSMLLGANFAQDCPPISYFRLVGRERVWLRRQFVGEGSQCAADAPLALFSTEPEESLDAPPTRALRHLSANIMYHAGMYSGRSE